MSQAALVLVVDDNAANRLTLSDLLSPEGYRVSEAADGITALRLAAEDPPDLMLLDVMMPGMDGFAVCRKLRSDPVLAELPVLFITALDDAPSRIAGLESGGDDFVTKPFNRTELRARVRTITRLNRYRRLQEAQAAAQADQTRYRNLFNTMEEGFFVIEMIFDYAGTAVDYRFLEVNPSFETQSGLANAVGKTVLELLPNVEPFWVQRFAEVALTGKSVRFVSQAAALGRWFEVHAFRPEGPERRQVAVLFSDISARVAAEAAQRESGQWLRAMFDQAAVGVAQIDADTMHYSRINQRFCDMTGYTARELAQLAPAAIVFPADLDYDLDRFARMRDGTIREFMREKRYVRKDGSIIWASVAVSVIGEHGQLPKAFVAVMQDITERKLAQEQMLRTQRLDNLGMLAAGIAHDFNNALAPITMAATLLRNCLTPDAGRRRNGDPPGEDAAERRSKEINPAAGRLLDIVEQCGARGAGLVRQLLSFASGASGERQLLQAGQVIKEVGDLAVSTFPKSIHISVELARELWPIMANSTQIHQVILNLCVNARDAMPQGGKLTLTAVNRTLDATAAGAISEARPGNFLLIEVRDNGEGIPPAVLKRIWEPFFTTKVEGKGTGLGLSTVKGIVQQHDGFVTVQTRAGYGTVFQVYLPAAGAGARGVDGATAAPIMARGRDELILVVEDDEAVRLIAAEILAVHGYRTITACDGAEAIAVFAPRAAEVSLLLTDLEMPLLGGQALAKALRRLRPNLPIVAMSGAASRFSSTSYKEFTTAYVAKPFRAETLLSVVHATLDKANLAEAVPPTP